MSVCVCVCVYVCACVFVRMCVHKCVRVCVFVRVDTHQHTYLFLRQKFTFELQRFLSEQPSKRERGREQVERESTCGMDTDTDKDEHIHTYIHTHTHRQTHREIERARERYLSTSARRCENGGVVELRVCVLARQ